MILGLFDGMWLLRRNYTAVISSGDKPEYKRLISTFFSSVAKLANEFNITNPIIGFDAWPYKKSEYITLKTSRYYPKESDRKEITPEMSEEEVKAAQEANKALEINLANEREFQHAKAFIKKYAHELGIPVACITGFEYDDLCYLIANKLGIEHEISLVSIDSDIRWMMGPTSNFCRCTKNRVVYKRGIQTLNPDGIPLLYYGILSFMRSNHNDIQNINFGKMSHEDACRAFAAGQLDFYLGDQSEKYNILLKALDPNTFYNDEVRDTLISQLEIDPMGYDDVSVLEFNSKHNVHLNSKLVGSMISKRDRSCSLLDKVIVDPPKGLA